MNNLSDNDPVVLRRQIRKLNKKLAWHVMQLKEANVEKVKWLNNCKRLMEKLKTPSK